MYSTYPRYLLNFLFISDGYFKFENTSDNAGERSTDLISPILCNGNMTVEYWVQTSINSPYLLIKTECDGQALPGQKPVGNGGPSGGLAAGRNFTKSIVGCPAGKEQRVRTLSCITTIFLYD
jgi:hypothetical protein